MFLTCVTDVERGSSLSELRNIYEGVADGILLLVHTGALVSKHKHRIASKRVLGDIFCIVGDFHADDLEAAALDDLGGLIQRVEVLLIEVVPGVLMTEGVKLLTADDYKTAIEKAGAFDKRERQFGGDYAIDAVMKHATATTTTPHLPIRLDAPKATAERTMFPAFLDF